MSLSSSATTPQPRHGVGAALLWACFLGCSWTWVIGMFLPIMLLRDYGLWGWVAFAVPNVIGSAAMGTVLRTPAASWNIVQKHPTAMRWFAAVTIAYHLYVVFWLFGLLWAALLCVLPWIVMNAVQRQKIGGWLPWISVGVAVVSWGCFSMASRLDGAWMDVGFSAEADLFASRLTPLDLWLLAPGFVGGFLLCPYMDPTFHRARYSTSIGTGRLAFLLGFGVVFGSMIVFSLMYAGLLRPLIGGGDTSWIASPWWVILGIHFAVQIAFSISAHSREFFTDSFAKAGRSTDVLVFLLIVGLTVWGVVARTQDVMVAGLTLGEAGYRLFLLVYGVVFPAYVLICMIPTRRRGVGLTSRRWVFAGASLLGMPMGIAGLILGQSAWLLGLYAALLMGRLVVECLPARVEAEAKGEPQAGDGTQGDH